METTGVPAHIPDYSLLANRVKQWGQELGFQKIGITDCDLSQAEAQLVQWLRKSFHGEMDYMQRHGTMRTRPEELVPGTIRIISARLDYLPESMSNCEEILENPTLGYISRYALGRDYHKVIRKKLQRLANRISIETGPFGYRAFTDSAPVMEKVLAEKAGLGWIGKHTNLIDKQSGSWFFLGEIYTDLPLPVDSVSTDHCGSCTACIDICPTQAIVAPYQLDARRCISYLTIELHGSIPVEFRPQIGNRIYGCDDCQIVCPWNSFARMTQETGFVVRHELDSSRLIDLFAWDEDLFLARTEGNVLRRLGHERWLRNIAVAMGNSPFSTGIVKSLSARLEHPSELVREHVHWALDQQSNRGSSDNRALRQ
jgi:epoxyqueuosine reductase